MNNSAEYEIKTAMSLDDFTLSNHMLLYDWCFHLGEWFDFDFDLDSVHF